uniref:immunoglobulin alpha-2 heavy chain-like n=1 Tax=Pristiophorus japonicus TaxID=55135 RepID=UPI00398EB687
MYRREKILHEAVNFQTTNGAVVPVLTQSPSLERVTEGHTARLQCTMRNARVSDTDVHWYRQLPGQDTEWVLTHEASGSTRGSPGSTDRLQPSRDISNNSFILTVTDVQPSDTAAYYCKVWGDISGSGTQLNVTSRKASPVLIQSPEVVTVPEGGTVQFGCTLESSNVNDRVDKYNVHWYLSQDRKHVIFTKYAGGWVDRSRGFSERFQLSRDVASNSDILTIRGVQRRDSAVYICGIWGSIYGKGTRLNVTSAVVPVLTQSPSLERVTEGHTARLQCTMRNARVSDTDVHWYRQLPGQDTEWVLTHEASGSTRGSPGSTDRLQPSRDTSNNSFILTVTDVQPSDTAAYYCKVWGNINGNGTQLNVT